MAAHNGHLDTVRFLLSQGVSLYKENDKLTAIDWCIIGGDFPDIVNCLLESASSEDVQTLSACAFIRAVNHCRPSVEKMLYGRGVIGSNFTVEKHHNVLHCASATKYLSIERRNVLEYLLSSDIGRSILDSHEDTFSDTPLSLACQRQCYDMVDLLLKVGADVNCIDESRSRPLHTACRLNDEKLVGLLLKYNPDVNSLCGVIEVTPLDIACRKGNINIIRLLLTSGADTNMKGEDGMTPFHEVCWRGNAEAVTLLLEYGADTDLLYTDSSLKEIILSKGYDYIIELIENFIEKRRPRTLVK